MKAGAFKSMAEPGNSISTEQLAEIQRHVESHNHFFLDAIAKNRRKTMKQIQEIADEHIHSAKQVISLASRRKRKRGFMPLSYFCTKVRP